MNKIEKLIKELCPNGVEWKELGEIGEFYGGLSGKNKDDFQNGNAKFATYMNIFSNISLETNINSFVRINENERQNIIEYGDVLFTCSSETPDECGMSSVLTEKVDEPIYLNSFCFGFRLNNKEILLPDFAKYLFRDVKIRKAISKTASGVTRYNISKKRFAKITIPIPPLPIQQEIVRILDKFTALEAELQAELEARRKQYEYYREKLLTFKEIETLRGGVSNALSASYAEWKSLGEIADVTKLAGFEFTAHIKYADNGSIIALRGLNVKNGSLDLSNVKYIDNSNFTKLSRSKLFRNDMLFTYVGTVGDVALIDANEKYYLAPNVSRIRFNTEIVNPKLMLFYFQTFYFRDNQINRYLAHSSLKNLTMENIRKFQIPIPPLSEQTRIVGILDKFEELVNQSLPAEIEARRKQYEYYREKLLTF